MEETKTLIDEFDSLQKIKKEIDIKIKDLREKVIKLAQEKNTDILFGTHKKCSVKEYEKVIYPEDKSEIIKLIKEKGLYEQLSSINYFKLNPKILKNEIDSEIISLVKKDKAFRVALRDMGI